MHLYLRLSPSIMLSHPLSPILRTVSALFYFHTWIQKYIHHNCSPSPSSYALCHPLVPGPILLSFPSFFKHISFVQRGFASVFQMCIYGALIRLPPHYLLFLYHPAPLLFSSLQCIVFYYLHAQTQCLNIFHFVGSFTLSCHPMVPLRQDPLI
jgi:hypothetical protein